MSTLQARAEIEIEGTETEIEIEEEGTEVGSEVEQPFALDFRNPEAKPGEPTWDMQQVRRNRRLQGQFRFLGDWCGNLDEQGSSYRRLFA